MHGVINSEISPKDLDYNTLTEYLKEPEYLIALLQAYAFNSYKYSLEGEWDHVTPGDYKKFISEELSLLEDKVWEALQAFQNKMRDFKNGTSEQTESGS